MISVQHVDVSEFHEKSHQGAANEGIEEKTGTDWATSKSSPGANMDGASIDVPSPFHTSPPPSYFPILIQIAHTTQLPLAHF